MTLINFAAPDITPSSSSSSQPPLSASHPPQPQMSTSTRPIYPPVLPPPDFFDLELEAEKLKDMFKVSNSLKNPLYDETGLVQLPVDSRGVLILDPESKTRMVDVEVELDCLYEYLDWIGSAKKEVGKEGKQWLEGLRKVVDRDMGEVFDEWHAVVDEERGKRGLTDRWTHWAHFKGQERRGEGEDGEWVVKKAVNEAKRDLNEVDSDVPVEREVSSADTEEHVAATVNEASGIESMIMAAKPIVVDESQEDDQVARAPFLDLVQPGQVIVAAHAEIIRGPLPTGEELTVMPPRLELVDLWW